MKAQITPAALDTENREQIRALIERADAKFRLSAKAWINGNNSRDPETLAIQERRHVRLAREGEAMLAPLGITCDYPGLYPTFIFKGFSEYTTEQAVLKALGKPRNWLRVTGEDTAEPVKSGFYKNRT